MIQPLFIGTTELLLISGVALLLFGGKKLPEMMRGMGKGVQEFKKGMREVTEPLEEAKEELQEDPQEADAEEGGE
ncbi:MAG: twin-arginine translocase TatA/TatE family subunit [Alloprevotella sp.]|nr:twin-arginine translocase TatA/TatE family subunit [Alloprevotella sp.]